MKKTLIDRVPKKYLEVQERDGRFTSMGNDKDKQQQTPHFWTGMLPPPSRSSAQWQHSDYAYSVFTCLLRTPNRLAHVCLVLRLRNVASAESADNM